VVAKRGIESLAMDQRAGIDEAKHRAILETVMPK